MPSRKRRRDTSRQPAAKTVSEHHPLEGFHLLPLELQHLIISLACLVPASSPTCLTPFSTDSATVFNLCLVNSELRSQVQHLLYKEVSITRPSQLYALQQTLLADLEKGKLVERLHIGPQDILPPYWWPLGNDYASGYDSEGTALNGLRGPFEDLMTSLDASCLPSGYRTRRRWKLEGSARGCREAAVKEATDAAQRSLGLDLLDRGTSPVKVEPIFEIQAALDLHLIRVRELEEQDPALLELSSPGTRIPLRCRNGRCDHYPALVITQTSASACTSQTQAPARAFTLPRAQLLRHLARPGAASDRFDHPLIFERSGFRVLVNAPQTKDQPSWRRTIARYQLRSRRWDIEYYHEAFDWPAMFLLQDEEAIDDLSPGDKALNAALVATATLGQNLSLARKLLDLMPNLRDLSLTGFLESTLEETTLPGVRRLSLGPPPVCWEAVMPLEELDSVEDLRIAGAPVIDYEIEMICQMPRLRRLEWSMAEGFSSKMELNIVETILLLAASAQGVKTSDEPEQRLEGSEGEEDTRGESQPATEAKADATTNSLASRSSFAPSILITLHPSDLDQVLDAAPTVETRTAWLEGLPSASGSALLLRQHPSPARTPSARPSRQSTSHVFDDFYADARTWWEGGAALERPG